MKKLIVLAILFATLSSYAQTPDNFDVGPYEVSYKGEGDFRFRLRKDVNLYDYFGLKKDTIIQKKEVQTKPFNKGFQLNLFMELPRRSVTQLYGVGGNWKHKVGGITYINAGLSFAYLFGKYNTYQMVKNEAFMEIGLPLSVEFSKIDYKKASLYAGVGVVPAIYTTVKSEQIVNGEKTAGKEYFGALLSPRIDFGGYIPVYNKIIRVGVFGEYKINCSGSELNIYKDHIGCAFLGANIGVVF